MTTPPAHTTTRRGFLQTSIATGAVIAGGVLPSIITRSAAARQDKAAKPLKILILGGTQFIGPAFVELARQRGHTITVFNRGITEKKKGSLGDDVERLVGNRDPKVDAGLKALEGGKWDVCIDDCGFYPRMVKASADLLAPNIRQYIFISSISCYAKNDKPNQDETAELATVPDATIEDMGKGGEFYGGLKVLCEQAAEKAMPGRTTIIRPGFIVGPGDPSDRFTYWPVRVQKGGEMLAPGTPDDPLQVIDVRDLAAFMLTCAEKNTTGTFNACGPKQTPSEKLTIGKLLEESKRACAGGPGEKTQLTWVSAHFLEAYSAPADDPIDTTIWIPPKGEAIGFHQWSNARGVAAGMTFRPVYDTIKDTLAWWPKEIERRVRVTAETIEQMKADGKDTSKVPDPRKIRAGMSPTIEAKVLEDWHKKEKGAG
jgi:2'-hydroxyisoflavone reductase